MQTIIGVADINAFLANALRGSTSENRIFGGLALHAPVKPKTHALATDAIPPA